jgi:hypothetical protein
VLSFACVALLILRGHKLSLQNALNKLFSAICRVFGVPSASAFCQARQKIEPALFQYLNEIICQDFYSRYEEDGLVKRWRGHRLLACDGSYLNLPDNEQTRQQFFLQRNQFEEAEAVQALACVLYDLLNCLAISATLTTRTSESRLLMEQMWEKTRAGDLLILDRNYASYALFARAVASGRELVVRLPQSGFAEARPLFKKGAKRSEKVVELKCPQSWRSTVRAQQLPERVKLRLIRVPLEGGEEIEVLATTLVDREQYPTSEFKWLYSNRWCEETFFERVKNIFEVERFSGTSPLIIRQDYYGVLFLATLESVLCLPDQQLLLEKAEERRQQQQQQQQQREARAEEKAEGAPRQPQVNHRVSYLALLERLVELLLSKRSTEKILEEMHHLFRTSPTRARPGRSYPRREEKTNRARLLRYHKYVKKLLA